MATLPSKPAVPIPPFEQGCQLIADSDIDSINKHEVIAERKLLLQSLRDGDLELMHKQLSYAGRRGNISPLHHQRVIRRDIVLTERARLHPVWLAGTIYVRGVGEEPLDGNYFSDVACRDEMVYQAAMGFLLSYMYLIQYLSDLDVAKHAGLVNRGITWRSWQASRSSVVHHLANRDVHDRFEYGELQLGRLNQIYRIRCLGLTYFTIHRDYWSYFGDNYMTLVALFALASIGLSALQVMTAFDIIPPAVMVTLYRFSIATLLVVTASRACLLALCIGPYVWTTHAFIVSTWEQG